MGLMDLFKPKYKNSNPEVRIDAINELDDEKILGDIVRNDENATVRQVAIEKISNVDVLKEIASTDEKYYVRKLCYDNIQDKTFTENSQVLRDIILNDSNKEEGIIALSKLNDDEVSADLVLNHLELLRTYLNDGDLGYFIKQIKNNSLKINIFNTATEYIVKSNAIRAITDQEFLHDIVMNNNDTGFRNAAIYNIEDEKVLAHVAKYDEDYWVRKEAVELITNEKYLIDIAKNSKYDNSQEYAIKSPILKNEEVLMDIVMNDENEKMRLYAIRNDNLLNKEGKFDNELKYLVKNESIMAEEAIIKIHNEKILKDFINNHEDYEDNIIYAALTNPNFKDNDILIYFSTQDKYQGAVLKNPNFTSEKMIINLAKNGEKEYIRRDAVKILENKDVLEEIAMNSDENISIRLEAINNPVFTSEDIRQKVKNDEIIDKIRTIEGYIHEIKIDIAYGDEDREYGNKQIKKYEEKIAHLNKQIKL